MRGKALKLIREHHGFKQKDLCKTFGISQNHLSELERGEVGLTLKMVEKYMKQFKIKASSVFALAEFLEKENFDGQLTTKIRQYLYSIFSEENP